jgi:threonine synthase
LKATAMHYISTRGTAPVLGFGEAMMTGLARDGGLYVPEAVPVMTQTEIAALAGLPYEEVAFRVMRPYLGGFFADDEFRGLIAKAYRGFHHAARAPMVQLSSTHFLLELFHGPTLAFKNGSPSSARPPGIRAARRWRRSGGWPMWRSSSCSRMVASAMCSGGR